MVVENIPGTSSKKCLCCSSWLRHYERHAGMTVLCQARGCYRSAEVGAHVRNAHGNARKTHHIVAFCKGHNNSTDRIDIGEAELAPAQPCNC
jgi:hypothetical protein